MRTKKEYKTDSKENYERFLKKYNYTEKDISFDKYKKNIQISNWMFIEYALRTGNKVSFPYGFGTLAVNKKKLKRFKEYKGVQYPNLRVDWKRTKEVGKRIFHTNEHSDGYNYRWYWNFLDAKIRLAPVYVFRACRYASREIAKYIKGKDDQYKQMYLTWKE